MPELPKALATWFPLVPRARPLCAPLDKRIAAVSTMAERARNATEAAAALNLTALITSDIGAHDLARDLCWNQFLVFAKHAPLNAERAVLAMEPIINLARLATREGDGDRAHHILDQALTAATDHISTWIDQREVDVAAMAVDRHGRNAMQEKLWIAFLSDGARALTRAGRWTEARQAAERCSGIGNRLLDGRQTAIIATIAADETDATQALIASTEVIEPWEEALITYFEMCSSAALRDSPDAKSRLLIDQIVGLALPQEQQLFQVRLGLSVLELACLGRAASELAATFGPIAMRDGDAYAARDLLSSPTFRRSIDPAGAAHLAEVLHRSGLEQGAEPALRERLELIADVAVAQLSRDLAEH
ncbi:hypothetical protein [Glycomyces harbinensis]|uniref:Uncharacterized protein n=1 Tax=Glycomyces harbinensis TaxID=58114 RepID=A0A1G6Y9H3_9ACTN|nr:hypothetical protein [Glycomyces harbinensis]SDD86942.1 hypothetical protein SAMN05216270_108208 [Glycomyces harbinensis]